MPRNLGASVQHWKYLLHVYLYLPEDVVGQGTSSFWWVLILEKAALAEKAITLKNRLDIGS